MALYGHCYKQGQDQAMHAVYETRRGYTDAILWTEAGFGCTLGEAR